MKKLKVSDVSERYIDRIANKKCGRRVRPTRYAPAHLL